MVRNDAAHKVGECVAQGLHQFGQLLLVHVPDGAEHALLGANAEHALVHLGHSHAGEFS